MNQLNNLCDKYTVLFLIQLVLRQNSIQWSSINQYWKDSDINFKYILPFSFSQLKKDSIDSLTVKSEHENRSLAAFSNLLMKLGSSFTCLTEVRI